MLREHPKKRITLNENGEIIGNNERISNILNEAFVNKAATIRLETDKLADKPPQCPARMPANSFFLSPTTANEC